MELSTVCRTGSGSFLLTQLMELSTVCRTGSGSLMIFLLVLLDLELLHNWLLVIFLLRQLFLETKSNYNCEICLTTNVMSTTESGTGQGQKRELPRGGDCGCSCCQNLHSDQPVWNTGTLYGCRVQPSASVQFKRRHTHRPTYPDFKLSVQPYKFKCTSNLFVVQWCKWQLFHNRAKCTILVLWVQSSHLKMQSKTK
jgi:hypothetical protein